MASDEAIPFREFVGKRLKAYRESLGLAQEQVAAMVRNRGLDWSRATVAHAERGNRDVSLDELATICLALCVHPGDLFKGPDVQIKRQRGTPVSSGALLGILFNPAMALPPGPAVPRPKSIEPKSGIEPADLQTYMWAWPDASQDMLVVAAVCAEYEPEQKAARKLGRHPVEVSLAALRQWGRCLSEERDRRLTTHGPKGTLQAQRGHVTRRLIDELRPLLTREHTETEEG